MKNSLFSVFWQIFSQVISATPRQSWCNEQKIEEQNIYRTEHNFSTYWNLKLCLGVTLFKIQTFLPLFLWVCLQYYFIWCQVPMEVIQLAIATVFQICSLFQFVKNSYIFPLKLERRNFKHLIVKLQILSTSSYFSCSNTIFEIWNQMNK